MANESEKRAAAAAVARRWTRGPIGTAIISSTSRAALTGTLSRSVPAGRSRNTSTAVSAASTSPSAGASRSISRAPASVAHLHENLAAASLVLPDDVIAALDTIGAGTPAD